MFHLISVLFQFLRRQLFAFALIVLALVAAPWVAREWQHMQRVVAELPALRGALRNVEAERAARVAEASARMRQLSTLPARALDAEVRAQDVEIARLEREAAQGGLLAAGLKGPDSLAAHLQAAALRDMELALRRQVRAHLLAVRAQAVVLADRQAARDKLAQLRLAHIAAYAAWERARDERARFEASAGWLDNLLNTPPHVRLKTLTAVQAQRLAASDRVHREFLAQRALLNRLPSIDKPAVFQVDEARLALASAALRAQLAQAEELAAKNIVWQVGQAVEPVLPAAFAAFFGWWLLPAALRSLFYFVLAPLAARRPPIQIDKAGSGHASTHPPARTSARISSVSLELTLPPGHEMLVRPDFAQSQPAGIAISTRLLFDWRRPFTSIAAHLWMLKQLRAKATAQVVVSSTSDPLDEVALLEIGPGEAFVLQPRGLVGMVYATGRRPKIRSHWRLGTLHAWLTLQLRYLAFEGPATLIVKGCRGVRLESADAGRTVSQEATLGFSSNARYATVRAEPFMPYLRGIQPLFHDRFDGSGACYLYEEVPRNAHPARARHNPLEMLADAGLRAFGI